MHVAATRKPLSRPQKQAFFAAYVVYAVYYVGRVNLSSAIPAMETELALNRSQLGLFGSLFFMTYAVGTLLNGRLGDMISPRWLIFVGLCMSALLNLGFALSSTYIALLFIWGFNGYFQSTGWGPALRLIANWLDAEQRQHLSGFFASCFVLGNAFTWLLAGWLVTRWSWRTAFWVPAILMLCVALLWMMVVDDHPADKALPRSNRSTTGFWSGISSQLERYWPLSLAAGCIGFVLVMYLIWTPTYFIEVGGLSMQTSNGVAAILPVAGLIGTVATGWLVSTSMRGREVQLLVGTFLLMALVFALQLYFVQRQALLIATFLLGGGVVFSSITLMLSILPLKLGGESFASTIAGLLDFASGLAGGLGGWLVGYLLDRGGWDPVYNMLMIVSMLGAGFVLLQFRN